MLSEIQHIIIFFCNKFRLIFCESAKIPKHYDVFSSPLLGGRMKHCPRLSVCLSRAYDSHVIGVP